MSNSDDILQGVFIASFSLIGLSVLSYCIRTKLKNYSKMKQSASMEDLSSVDTTDPTQTQV